MKIKHLLMASVALVAGMASCSKDNGNGGEGDFNFYLKVSENGMGTRADADEASAGPVKFNDGAIFFTAADGTVVRYVRITTGFGSGTVSPEQLTEGYLFAGINYTAEAVHIVGNLDFGTTASLGNISELETGNYLTTLRTQTDDVYGVSKATLYGSSPLVPATSSKAVAANANREAQIELAPIIGRFEIEKVSSADTRVGTGFKLEGIYIDDFYYKATVTGKLSDFQDIVYAEGVSYKYYTNEHVAGGLGRYIDEWNPILFDDGSWDYTAGTLISNPGSPAGLGTATSKTVEPANEAWVYNFFPDATRVPHIILHLTGVEVDGGTYTNSKTGNAGEAYLTVTGYKETGKGSAKLEGGYIYRISNLEFKADDLREEPEQPDPDPDKEKLDVWVEVELMDWTVVPTEVEFN